MAYTPRTATTIRREIAARIVARGTADDIAEGSVLAHMIQTWAEELAGLEVRLARIRDSFFLDSAVGTDLDDRVSDLPPSGLTRLAASSASGGALTLTRTDTALPLLVPEGSTYGRTADSSLTYRQIADVNFLAGEATKDDVAVVCLTPGEVGNAPGGAIDRVASSPVTGAVSTAAITNGQDEESDEALRARARAYLSSLTGTTPAALEHLGRSFTATDGSRAAFARIFEDPTTPGLCELLVDDGGGLLGYMRQGAPVTGTVPTGGPPVLWHETPSVEPIEEILIARGGVVWELAADEYTSFPERGLVYVHEDIDAARQPVAGDTWAISKYNVFMGLPAELQALIEGSLSEPLDNPGYRAAGVRVRVVAPLVFNVSLAVNVVPVAGRDFDAVTLDVETAVVEYLATLGPGETLFIARLIDRVMDNSDVLTVRFYASSADLTPADDIIPPSSRYVLRTDAGRIAVVPLPQEV